jgi:hypothetical protein
MDGLIVGLADTATGAAVARAFEPAAGEGRPSIGETRCLNCGTFLIGSHCHQCGQHVHIHRTVGTFWHDFLHSVLHFEGKAWRTLPILAWRPGELTRRYIEGERAQFVSPLALFLLTVFLTFAVFNSVGIGAETGVEFDAQEEAAVETEFRQASAAAERAITDAEAMLANARRQDLPTAQLEAELNEKRAAAGVLGLGNAFVNDNDRDGFTFIGGVETGIAWVDDAIAKANANPELALYKLQSNSYKYSWLLIPLSAPFLWLLFPFSRRFGWYDHLVFVTYSISFMALLWVVLRLVSFAGIEPGMLWTFGVLYAPFHMYRQLRGAYRCSRIGAVLRTAMLQAASFATILGFMLVLLGLELMG